MTKQLVQTFIKNRHYLKKANVELQYVEDDNAPYIYIQNPVIISAFAGFIKNRMPEADIYFRGEAGNHAHIIPSLFREKGMALTDSAAIQNRYKAYRELKKDTILYFRDMVSRFKNEEVDNLFQHYGIKSPVIDMVDNIYVAIWFAMDGNTGGHGFIRLMNTSHTDLTVSDLRKKHSSLSLRLHTQHGLIAKKKVHSWNKRNILYDQYEIARIKFPVSPAIESGLLFSAANMYPDVSLDNTFKILKNSKWLAGKIAGTEKKYGLPAGSLGTIR